MSRHEVVDDTGRWVFGWDQPLMSFFLHFHDKNIEDDENPVIWLGATKDTVMYEVDDLVRVARKNGLKINYEMRVILYGERDFGA